MDIDFVKFDTAEEQFSCANLPAPTHPFGWQTVFPRSSVLGFALNPWDNNQVIYNQLDYYGVRDSVFTYDILRHERRFLLEANPLALSWGRQNWLLYERANLYKFKSDGSGFAQMNLPTALHSPIWSPNGEQFVYESSDNLILRADLNESIYDTLPVIAAFDWFSRDSILVLAYLPGSTRRAIHNYSISTDSISFFANVPIEPNPNLAGIVDLKMFPDHQRIAILTKNGIWIASRQTHPLQILESCDNRRVVAMEISNDGRYIYAEVVKWTQIDSVYIKKSESFVRFDARTGKNWETIMESN